MIRVVRSEKQEKTRKIGKMVNNQIPVLTRGSR